MNYKLVVAEDGIVWVCIQPLMRDVSEALENAKKIDVTDMDDSDKRGVDFTVLSMEAVYNFLNSLMAEADVTEFMKKQNNKKDLH